MIRIFTQYISPKSLLLVILGGGLTILGLLSGAWLRFKAFSPGRLLAVIHLTQVQHLTLCDLARLQPSILHHAVVAAFPSLRRLMQRKNMVESRMPEFRAPVGLHYKQF